MRKWLFGPMIVLIVLAGALALRHQLQVAAQNKNFHETQTWLRSILDEVVRQNPGSERVSDPYCRRPSAKFETRERYCVINELVMQPVNSGETLEKITHIQKTIDQNAQVTFRSLGEDKLVQRVAGHSFTKNDLPCSVVYYALNNENGTSFSPKITEPYTGLLISASCSGDAMADFFPSRR